MTNPSVLCLICARGGSKGVPRKNIRHLAGKPLIAHSIQQAQSLGIFAAVVVSTDDAEIARTAIDYGAEVPFLRPPHLASDTASKVDAMLYTVETLRAAERTFDLIVDKDPTVPFIGAKEMKAAAELCWSNDADAVIGVAESHINPYFNMVESGPDGFLKLCKEPLTGMASRFVRRQDCPKVYGLHGLITVKEASFRRNKHVYSERCLPLVCDPMKSLMIDTELDFQFAEFLVQSGRVTF